MPVERKSVEFQDYYKEEHHKLPSGDFYCPHYLKYFLSVIDKFENNQDFNIDDLRFLYEVNHARPKPGFPSELEGYNSPSILIDIRESRNLKRDLSLIYQCSTDQIADSPSQMKDNTRIYLGELYKEEDSFILNNKNQHPLIIFKSVHFIDQKSPILIHNVHFVRGVEFNGSNLISISENIIFNHLAYFINCTSLTAIPNNTIFNLNAYFNGCTSLTSIGENVIFNKTSTFNDCTALTYISKNTFFNNNF